MKHVETDISFLKQLNARQHEAFKVLFKDYYQDLALLLVQNIKRPHRGGRYRTGCIHPIMGKRKSLRKSLSP